MPQKGGINIAYEKKIVKVDNSSNGDCVSGCAGTFYSAC